MKRRTFIKESGLTAFSVVCFGAINWNGIAFVGDNETTTDILGPFYRPGAPMRNNLIPPGSTGKVLNLSGTVLGHDGKTPLSNVLIEAWQCDESAKYDNVSDNYLYRGAVKTGKTGKYTFKTIIPVSYKDGEDWRPAHIHMRISSASHQDLITQIYFKGDPHIEKDAAASAPQSVKRILEIKKISVAENAVKFDIVMGKTYRLEDAGYKKITGLYQLNKGNAEFSREDDLLILKLNGQIMEGLVYKGNNTFEGGLSFNKVRFEILANGDVKTYIIMWDMPSDKRFLETYEGVKMVKYGY
ncbi:MAG: catechol 1,2-dioxygenase [Bacteroidota bacterium]|nr:catechol 1,2-dioxygenase [Bacteroidota bacterium]